MTDAFHLPLTFFRHREKGRKKWKREKQTRIGFFFFFGLCIMELETLYLTLCKILRKIKTLAVYQLFTFSVPSNKFSESKKIQLSIFLTVAGI